MSISPEVQPGGEAAGGQAPKRSPQPGASPAAAGPAGAAEGNADAPAAPNGPKGLSGGGPADGGGGVGPPSPSGDDPYYRQARGVLERLQTHAGSVRALAFSALALAFTIPLSLASIGNPEEFFLPHVVGSHQRRLDLAAYGIGLFWFVGCVISAIALAHFFPLDDEGEVLKLFADTEKSELTAKERDHAAAVATRLQLQILAKMKRGTRMVMVAIGSFFAVVAITLYMMFQFGHTRTIGFGATHEARANPAQDAFASNATGERR